MPGPRSIRILGEIVVWWAASLGVWLISLSAVPRQELVVAALSSLPCGIAAYGARRALEDDWVTRLRWWRPALLLPVAIITDSVQVFAAVARRRGGVFQEVRTAGRGEDPVAGSRRALDTALVSVTPGNYVLDVDPGTGRMLVHSMGGRGPNVVSLVSADSP